MAVWLRRYLVGSRYCFSCGWSVQHSELAERMRMCPRGWEHKKNWRINTDHVSMIMKVLMAAELLVLGSRTGAASTSCFAALKPSACRSVWWSWRWVGGRDVGCNKPTWMQFSCLVCNWQLTLMGVSILTMFCFGFFILLFVETVSQILFLRSSLWCLWSNASSSQLTVGYL